MKELRPGKGMWRTEPQECKTQDDLAMVQELTSTGEFKTIIGLYYKDDAKRVVQLHNAVIEKLNERTIRQVCEDSGIPMKMTPDGIAFSMPDISFPNASIARQFAQRIMQEVNALRTGDSITILHSDDPWVDGGEGGFSKAMTEAISDAIEQGGDAQRESMRKSENHEG